MEAHVFTCSTVLRSTDRGRFCGNRFKAFFIGSALHIVEVPPNEGKQAQSRRRLVFAARSIVGRIILL
jgi:hypothetical protein